MEEQIKEVLEKILVRLENNDESLITVGQATELTQLSERTIRDIILEPDCPIVRVGRAVRIKKIAFISYLEERRA